MDERSPGKGKAKSREQAQRTLRLQQVVRTVIRAAASAVDSEALLRDACHELVDGYPFSQAWAFIQDANGSLQQATPVGVTSAFEVMVTEVAQGRPPSCLAEAMQSEVPIRYESAGEICQACPVRGAHSEGDVWVIPLRFQGRWYGTLFVLGPATGGDTPALLQDAGDAIGAGLHRLEQQAARVAAEHRFQRLVDNLMGMVYQCHDDEQWTMRYMSAGTHAITGYRPGQLVGNAEVSYEQLIHPGDRARVRSEIQSAVSEGRPFVVQYRILHADGTVRHVVERGQRVANGSPESASLEGIVSDVTERVRHEERAHAASQELEAFFEVALDLFVITDHEGRVLKLNQRWEEVLGYSLDDLMGINILDFVHPDDREATIEALGRTAQGESVHAFINRHRCADGSYRHLEWQAHSHGTVNFAAARDVTERQAQEETLRRSEERFRMLIEGAPEPVFVQLEGRFEYLNQAACKLFGVSQARDLIGQSVLDRFHPDYRDIVRQRIKQLNEKIEPVPVLEERILRIDGYEVPVEVSAVPYEHEGKRGALVFLHDLTARKRVEEKQRELEGQLQQAQKIESVGRLAGGVAHDFNNMLAPILGHAEFLAEDLPEDHAGHESLAEIAAAAERARDIAGQLLSFSRKKPLRKELTDLNEIVLGFQRMLGNLLGEDIILITNLTQTPLPIFGDASQLEQVLLNLAVNARDAMPDGGRFRIETEAVTLGEDYIAERPLVAPGDYALLAVSDEGTGMDEATRIRIFDPFFSTKEHDKGTGLGLSNVYGIVKQHEGQIWVYSEPGHGTTFKVYIPLATVEPTERPQRSQTVYEPGEMPERPARILVLEDQQPVRLLVVRMLERMGHEPMEAATLAEARELAANAGTIDLMISDVILPDGKGPDAYEELRELHGGMGIIFMSGYTEHAAVGDFSTPDRFLQKPFTVKKLREIVTKALAGGPPTP